MTRFASITSVLLTTAAAPSFADGHAGTMGYALANNGTTLVTMDSIAEPGAINTFELSTPLAGIAYRPVTGALVGIADGAVYTVNAMTGELTDLGATFADEATIASGAMTAFDFNNAIDAVRAVTSAGANLVYFPVGFGDDDDRANSVLRFTDPFYAEGDLNVGTTPMIFANAYTNAIAGSTASSTFQYAIDAETDSLVSLANNAGELMTVGSITVDGAAVDFSGMGGFDIVSAAEGQDAAYAILQTEGASTAGLYAINLETAEATLLADLGMGGFTGFAVSMGM